DLRRRRCVGCPTHRVYVPAYRTREGGDGGAADLTRDAPARLEVAGGGDRETRLDHVDAKLLELARDAQLGVGVEVEAWRLFAVAQRGVEDEYSVRVRVFHFSTGSNHVIIERSSRPTCSIWCSASFLRMP